MHSITRARFIDRRPRADSLEYVMQLQSIEKREQEELREREEAARLENLITQEDMEKSKKKRHSKKKKSADVGDVNINSSIRSPEKKREQKQKPAEMHLQTTGQNLNINDSPIAKGMKTEDLV